MPSDREWSRDGRAGINSREQCPLNGYIDTPRGQGSFEAYKSRVKGKHLIRLPEVVIKALSRTVPRSDYLTGVQYRLNALGFGAGPVDGIMGSRTKKVIITFQSTYPSLKVDGIPGPKTQTKLSEVCGF